MSELDFFSPIKRGLIIKKEWLDLILSGEKTWELRSTKTKCFGNIALIEQGSGLIVGTAFLGGNAAKITCELQFKQSINYHKVVDLELWKKWPNAWLIYDARRLKKPISYNHPKGAVIWVNLEKEGVINND